MEMIELLSLWKRTSKEGQTYLGGTLGNNNVLIFTNKRKQSETSPDYYMFLAPKAPDQKKVDQAREKTMNQVRASTGNLTPIAPTSPVKPAPAQGAPYVKQDAFDYSEYDTVASVTDSDIGF